MSGENHDRQYIKQMAYGTLYGSGWKGNRSIKPLFWEQRRSRDEMIWMERMVEMINKSGDLNDGK